MKTKLLSILGILLMSLDIHANEINNTPFGWGACSDEKGTPYQVDGGWRHANPTSIVLYASGGDDCDAILNAITNYDIVVLDGSKGDFLFSSIIWFPDNLCNRSILGRNNARLCTQWYITSDLKAVLKAANLSQYSSNSGTGGTLSNGEKVDEERELHTRQLILDYTEDEGESYRWSGFFWLNSTNENIIFRNLVLVGPGSVDIGGADLISVYGATHVWIDHCEFIDGLDGNLDTGYPEDKNLFCTYSWNIFRYTERSFSHSLSNGIGWNFKDYPIFITYAYNIWGEGCDGRMPLVDSSYLHLLNNYYNCIGNGRAIDIYGNTHVLAEGNYVEEGVNEPFVPNDFETGNLDTHFFITRENIGFGGFDNACHNPQSVEVPYVYTRIPTTDVPNVLTGKYGAGATLPNDYFTLPPILYEQTVYSISENETFASGTTIKCPNISLTYGEVGGPDFLPALPYPLNGFPACTPGNEVNGDLPGGTFYVFVPQNDGILTIGVRQNRKKKLYVEENGIALADFNGITLDESHPEGYMFSLPVKACASYKLYCSGSKLRFYGFIFKWNKWELGDVNGDGSVNAADIVCLVKMMLFPADSDNPFADLNSDHVVNDKDIKEVVKSIMSK